MFRDTLSVSWSYSCYILCCWLAINILIVLAFFSFTALSSTRVVLTQFNPAFWYFYWCAKNLQKNVSFLLFDFDLPKLEKIMLKLFSVPSGKLVVWILVSPCYLVFLSYYDFLWRLLIHQQSYQNTGLTCMKPTLIGSPTFAITLRRAKLGHLVLRTKERERCVSFFLLFAVHGKYWGMVASSSSCLWGNEKPVKKWKQPKGKNLI